jgi:hypothetical protein
MNNPGYPDELFSALQNATRISPVNVKFIQHDGRIEVAAPIGMPRAWPLRDAQFAI